MDKHLAWPDVAALALLFLFIFGFWRMAFGFLDKEK